jgi:hypothetical protein
VTYLSNEVQGLFGYMPRYPVKSFGWTESTREWGASLRPGTTSSAGTAIRFVTPERHSRKAPTMLLQRRQVYANCARTQPATLEASYS